MESLYADFPDERAALAGRLAWHFQEAERPAKAAHHYTEAGDAALRLYAYDEAAAYFQNRLTQLEAIPAREERDRIELRLLIGLGSARYHMDGGAAPGLGQLWRLAHQLSDEVGELHQRFQVLRYEWEVHFQRGEMRSALTQGEACLHIANAMGDGQLESHVALGPTLYRMGKMVRASYHFEQALALCDDSPAAYRTHMNSENPMVNAWVNGALVWWYLGYADRARSQCLKGVDAADALNHPFSRAFALTIATALYQRMAMAEETEHYARQNLRLNEKHGFALWTAVANLYCGWARVVQGEMVAGLQQTEIGLEAIRAAGMEHIRFAAVLADVNLRCGRTAESLALVESLLARVEQTQEREWEAELYRLKGESLLHQGGGKHRVDDCFERAVAIAAAQQSKSLELRATVSLARSLSAHDNADKGHQRVASLFHWFTEGFDTPDLIAAAMFLDRSEKSS